VLDNLLDSKRWTDKIWFTKTNSRLNKDVSEVKKGWKKMVKISSRPETHTRRQHRFKRYCPSNTKRWKLCKMKKSSKLRLRGRFLDCLGSKCREQSSFLRIKHIQRPETLRRATKSVDKGWFVTVLRGEKGEKSTPSKKFSNTPPMKIFVHVV